MTPFSDFESSKNLIENLVTLGAVILGGAITYVSTYLFERRKEKRHQQEQAWSLFFVVQDLVNDLVQLNVHVHQSVAQAEQNGVLGDNWTKIPDVVGFSEAEKYISTDQLVILAALKDAKLMMDVREIGSAHTTYLKVIRKLIEMRGLLESSTKVKVVDGSVIGFEADAEEFAKVAPLILKLKGLGDGLALGLPGATAKAMRTAELLGPRLKSHYKFKDFSSVTFPDAAKNPSSTRSED